MIRIKIQKETDDSFPITSGLSCSCGVRTKDIHKENDICSLCNTPYLKTIYVYANVVEIKQE